VLDLRRKQILAEVRFVPKSLRRRDMHKGIQEGSYYNFKTRPTGAKKVLSKDDSVPSLSSARKTGFLSDTPPCSNPE
jgi:hypothetical protein